MVNAYANADLKKPLLGQMAEGFEKKGMMLRIFKALYGLKTSALLWYQELVSKLNEFGLEQVAGVNCLFTNEWLTVIFYVDDIVVFYAPQHESRMNQFETKLDSAYEMHKLGEVDHFLGIRVIRDMPARKTWLLQDSYISNLAIKFNIIVTKVPNILLPAGDLVPNPNQATTSQIHGYQQKVGSLNYPTYITRPECARLAKVLC